METLKNLNSSFKLIKLFSLVIVLFSLSFSGVVYYMSEQKVQKSREKIYVLTNNDALELALSKNPEVNRRAEI